VIAGPPDPFALLELSHDVRPPDYAGIFARTAVQDSGLARPISVCALERPDWLRTATDIVGVELTSPDEALEHYTTCA
jgi:hypothetical protein